MILSLCIAFSLVGCTDGFLMIPKNPSSDPVAIPARITFQEESLYPEGIDYDTINNRFLVSSFRKGEVGTVDLTGRYTRLVTDDNLTSALGVLVEEEKNRVLVVSGDAGLAEASAPDGSSAGTKAYLASYDLSNGERQHFVEFASLTAGAGVFPNDIAVDERGDLYVTDSFAPVIYRIDGASFEASIFLDGQEAFSPTPGGFGLNGIVYTDGLLIVSKTDDGQLFRIPVDHPANYAPVRVEALPGADGLELDREGQLVVVQNGLTEATGISVLASDDSWATARVVSRTNESAENFPTTAALAEDGRIYYLNASLGRTLAGDFSQSTYSIVRIDE